MEKKTNTFGKIAAIGVIAAALVAFGIIATSNLGKSSKEISSEEALKDMSKILKKVDVLKSEPRKANVEIGTTNLKDELPDISKYPLSVTGNGEINIEIFSSTEKSSSGSDGWLNEVAEDFNNSGVEINGKSVSISVRPIASGLAVDYIISGKYIPDAYTPSNTFWGEMIKSNGTDIEMVEDCIVGNTVGILMSNDAYSKVEDAYGTVSMETTIDATIDNVISMGYTNPYSSSAGLNFLVTALNTFDSSDPLSETATQKFAEFQANIPFVAYTTLQMREAVDTGVLDAFILEYQTVYNDASLKNYKYIPFGARHDNPMYSIGSLTSDEQKALEEFTAYCTSEQSQDLADDYGFNQQADYKSTLPDVNGSTLIAEQKLWKKEKDAGKPIVAVFVADTSGSMDGEPLNQLKQSLINASQYINSDNYIGLVSYSDDVTVNLPIDKFDINQRSYFVGGVEDLIASGGTATYDAIMVASDMLVKAQKDYPDAKVMLFVLSDGETNKGCHLDDIKSVIKGLQIPVYTIGYNADLSALSEISALNEAASINADSDDVVYKLKNLFNAQM